MADSEYIFVQQPAASAPLKFTVATPGPDHMMINMPEHQVCIALCYLLRIRLYFTSIIYRRVAQLQVQSELKEIC